MEKGEGGGDLNFPPKNTQTEVAAAVTLTWEAKKLARQLDFNSIGGSASVPATTVVLPEHPHRPVVSHMQRPLPSPSQPHPQIEVAAAAVPPVEALVAAAKKLAHPLEFNSIDGSASVTATTAVLPEHSHRPVATQMQEPPPSPSQPHLHPHLHPMPLMSSMQQSYAATTHQQSHIRHVKTESPKARPRQNVDITDGTPKKQKQCNCKNSRCLKLYCECFANGIYCDGCNCANCCNNVENEAVRREAVEATLERNPNAFRPKIASSPHGNREKREDAGEVVVLGKHNKGCHCKKSGCLKKYCECFQANILCSDNCKCLDCKNFEGSEERQALFHGDSANNIAYLQQAANAAITGAIGSSGYGSPPVSRKRKAQELFFGGSLEKDSSVQRLPPFQQQTSHIRTSAPSTSLSPIPAPRVANATPVGPSKVTYRSLLADLIRPDDMKELCSLLVVYAKEAARMLADDQREGSDAPSYNRIQSQKEPNTEKAASEEPPADKTVTDESVSDDTDASKGRPMSPGTLALMCDEQDTVFTSSTSNGANVGPSQLPNGQVLTETYAAQEKIVLTAFRDCLNKLITFGELKETQCSSLARSDLGGQSQTDFTETNTNGYLNIPFRAENGEVKVKSEKET